MNPEQPMDIFSPEGFKELQRIYLLASYRTKFWESVTWRGVRCLQYAEDLLAISEAFFQVQPTVFVEVGVFQGGGLLFYDTLMSTNRRGGKIIGVDANTEAAKISVQNAKARSIELITGDSKSAETVSSVYGRVPHGASVMVLLDSDHSAAHVAAEIDAYAPLVTRGSYLIVMDGAMRELAGDPANPPGWVTDNPATAVDSFMARTTEFERDLSKNRFGPSLAPGGFLRKKS